MESRWVLEMGRARKDHLSSGWWVKYRTRASMIGCVDVDGNYVIEEETCEVGLLMSANNLTGEGRR